MHWIRNLSQDDPCSHIYFNTPLGITPADGGIPGSANMRSQMTTYGEKGSCIRNF
jgi:hypothetical protein